jgi:hypothetical protein
LYRFQTAEYVVIGGNFSNNAYNSVTGTRLMFGGGNDDAQNNYFIGTNLENYNGNYNKLDLRWHTGIRMGAQPSYGGIRFYDTEDLGTQVFAIGKDGSYAQANQSMRAPIFYDLDNTGYYLDPTSTTSLRTVGSWRADSSSWDGEFSGKIQYHSNHWYVQAAGLFLYRNSNGSNVFEINQSGTATATSDFRSPIFYDSNNTGYYCDPASTSNLYTTRIQNVIEFPTSSGASANRGGPAYNIYQESGGWSHPYPDLCIGFHTGISFGAHPSYEGMRFFTDYNFGSLVFQVNGGSNYLYKYQWMYTNSTGLYSDSNSAHIYPNSGSSYTQWRIDGNKNGYGGIWDSYSGVNGFMYDSGGNGGVYREANGRWYFYHHLGNNCMGVNTSTTSSSYGMYVSGGIYSTGNVVAYSDRRSKTDIKVIDNALDKLLNLRGVTYRKIDLKTNEVNEKIESGVIAQEVNEVFPEVVTYAEDIDEYGVSYGNFVGLFIEAIKEQTAIINNLKKEIENLKSKLGE